MNTAFIMECDCYTVRYSNFVEVSQKERKCVLQWIVILFIAMTLMLIYFTLNILLQN
jgi:hypothetical protein